MNYGEESIKMHKEKKGKLEIKSKVPVNTRDDLSIAYTPGVAAVSMEIAKDKKKVYELTIKQNSVAVITDGSAVLGLGNIGPEAAMPVMEGKSILFKEFAGIDAYPICLATQDTEEIIKIVKAVSPGFGGVNLEDISAPRCFEIEERLQDIGIPVMHDDQHGTSVVVLAALMNALKITKKENVKIVISGAGAAGIAVTKMILASLKVKDIILCDSKGIISKDRKDLTREKIDMLKLTNDSNIKGFLADAIKGADIFIGVSKAGLVTKEMVQTMNKDPIIIAMANPVPEIMPDEAVKGGAFIVGTGRSDFPNQINNVLGFPGIFLGALQAKATVINKEMKLAAAKALASCVEPKKDMILPSPLDKSVVPKIAEAVKKAAIQTGVVRKD